MLKQLILLHALFFFHTTFSQNFDWASQFAGDNYSQGLGITSDSEGNIISAGAFNGTYDFDPSAVVAEYISYDFSEDIYITKQDETGALLWVKQVGSSGGDIPWALTTDDDDNIFVTGQFQGTVNFGDVGGDETVTGIGAGDIFILKLNSDGEFLWVKTMGSPDSESGESIVIDASNNIIVTGFINNGTVDMDPGAGTFNLSGFFDSFILKLNSDGEFIWAKILTNPTDMVYISDCSTDAAGSIFMVGHFKGTTNFNTSGGTDNLTSAGNRDIFVCKLNSSGNLVWVKQMGGSGSEIAWGMDLDAAGNIFITGNFNNTVDFDPGAGTMSITSAGDADIFACKLDASGNFVWAGGFGGPDFDQGEDIQVNAAGAIYITGAFSSTADFDPGVGTTNLISAGTHDGVLIELQADGTLTSARKIGGPESDWMQALTLDADDNLFITGWFSAAADLDPTAGTENYTAISKDAFVIRMKNTGTDIKDNNSASHFVIYPNPAQQYLTIQSNEQIETIAIYNLAGEIIATETTTTFSVEQLASGTYILQIKTASANNQYQFIKN